MAIDNTRLGFLNQQYAQQINPNSNPFSSGISSTQSPKVGTEQKITPYDKDMADFRSRLPQNNGSGELNPFSVNSEQGQNLYVKEGAANTQNTIPSETYFQSRGENVLNTQFNGDSIAAMEYLNQLELA